jgi:hypothetical protein
MTEGEEELQMPAPTDGTSPAELFMLLQEHAEGLRAKGVRVVKMGSFEFALDAPEVVPAARGAAHDFAGFEGDPLRDPRTYGGRGRVPGFPRIREMRDEGVMDETG